jgi:hypothetical protein
VLWYAVGRFVCKLYGGLKYFAVIQVVTYTIPVTQMVEALYYKPEGSGFGSQWCH